MPFDWVAFSAMLLVGRRPGVMAVGRQELWVGREDPSVLVLRDTGEWRRGGVDWCVVCGDCTRGSVLRD